MGICKNLKRKLCCMALVGCTLIGSGAVVHADTSDFTLTVTRTGYNQDNLSKRTLKAGGSNYENKCYVRATGFTGTGTIAVKSVKLDDTSIYSKKEISLGSASSVGVLKNEEYNKYAASGKNYYLQARFVASASGDTLNTVGRYTP